MQPPATPDAIGHKGRDQKKAVLYEVLATAADTAVTTKAMSPDHVQSLLRAIRQQEKTRFSGTFAEFARMKTTNRGRYDHMSDHLHLENGER